MSTATPTDPTAVPVKPFLRVLRQPQALRGHAFGLHQPCLLVDLQLQVAPGPERLAAVAEGLTQALAGAGVVPQPPAPAAPDVSADRAWLEAMLRWLYQLQAAAGLPVVGGGRLLAIGSAADGLFRLALPAPCNTFRATDRAWAWLLKLAEAAGAGADLQPVLGTLPALLERLHLVAPRASNTARFLLAAHALGMPTAELPGGVFQYGQGARAHWLNSSFTEHSPQLGALLARNKDHAADVLRRLGLPCPEHSLVVSPDEAVRVAERLGYPVVVKPADRDGGVAVAAGLHSADEVRRAHGAAASHSRKVLVERHVEGLDYRLVVFQGELICAYERQPGGVLGDGQGTVRALVDAINADPHRGHGPHALLKRLELDTEAHELLAAQGLDEDSRPAPGRFVRLRRAANISVGGTPVPVLDRVHPDNRLLAIRAAAALRLDLAGIDLLIPDIARSWREVGGWLCEVNGQPTLARPGHEHLFPLILRRLVSGDGRIPIALFIGEVAGSGLLATSAELLRDLGLRCGLSQGRGVLIGGHTVLDSATDFVAGQLLTTDRQVEAVLLGLTDESVLAHGLPFDRFDLLVVGALAAAGTAASTAGTASDGLPRLVRAVLPACTGPLLGLGDAGCALLTAAGARVVEPVDTGAGPDAAARRIAALLVQADQRHRSA